MLLDLLHTPTVLHFQIPLIQAGRIIQIYLRRVDKDNFFSNMQTSQNQVSPIEQAKVNLSKVMGDFIGDQKNINTQVNQRIDHVETSFNQKFDSLQTNLTQKIDNM